MWHLNILLCRSRRLGAEALNRVGGLQVYKFERLQPLSYYATAEQPPRKGSLPWGRSGKDDILADRCRMVRYSPLVLISTQHSQALHAVQQRVA